MLRKLVFWSICKYLPDVLGAFWLSISAILIPANQDVCNSKQLKGFRFIFFLSNCQTHTIHRCGRLTWACAEAYSVAGERESAYLTFDARGSKILKTFFFAYFFAVWYEPTDVHKASKPFLCRDWSALAYTSPNLAELKRIVEAVRPSLKKDVECIDPQKLHNIEEIRKPVTESCRPLLETMNCIMVTLGQHGMMVVFSLIFVIEISWFFTFYLFIFFIIDCSPWRKYR